MQTMLKQIEPSATPSSVEWLQIDPDALPGAWGRYRGLVKRALDAGEGSYNERDVLFGLLAGNWQLWAYGDLAICITEIVQFPRQRKLLIRYIAGEWAPFLHNLALVEAYARETGCQRIEAYMRKGLTRMLPKDWTVRHIFMVKELD